MPPADSPYAPSRKSILVWTLVAEGGLAGLAFILGWIFDFPATATLAWRNSDAVWGIAAAAPMLIAFVICVDLPIRPLEGMRRFSRQVIPTLFAHCTWYDILFVSGMAGLAEELLFRGVVQCALTVRLGHWPGLLIAALIFGLAHPITPMYVVFATVVGVYLGGVWMLSGNLLVPIMAHAIYDFVALNALIIGRDLPEVELGMADVKSEPEGALPCSDLFGADTTENP